MGLIIAASNDINALGHGIQNACPTADCGEMIHMEAEPEFGLEKDVVMIVKRHCTV